MSQDMMSTKEVAKYLDIHEKQVYALIREDKIPCTKVTGKWIFPKNLIDDWIQKSAKSGMKEARAKSLHIAGSLLVQGAMTLSSTCSLHSSGELTRTSTFSARARGAWKAFQP